MNPGAIAAAARIRLGVVLYDVIAAQLVEGDVDERGRVEEEVVSALILLNEAKSPVGDPCDFTLCHSGLFLPHEEVR